MSNTNETRPYFCGWCGECASCKHHAWLDRRNGEAQPTREEVESWRAARGLANPKNIADVVAR